MPTSRIPRRSRAGSPRRTRRFARAKRERALILWGDEMGLRSDHPRGRRFSPSGQTPVVGKAGKRFSCNVIQAVGNRGELWFRVFAGRFTQAVDDEDQLAAIGGADEAALHPAHRGRKARAFIAQHPELLEVVYLPGYSPDLNPAEYLNNDTKHGVLTKRPATPDGLVSATRRHLHRRQKQPQIVRNFFQHPAVAYAA